MRKKQRRFGLTLCALALALFVLLNTAASSAANEEDLAKLKAGMTKPEVLQVMGKPDSQGDKRSDDLCGWFTYKNVGRYKYVNIWFDCQDKLVAIDKASK